MSVALDTLSTMVDMVPAETGGPKLGYMKAVTHDARRELDMFLEDRDPERLAKINRVIAAANAYLSS